jgi:Uma2 family endonuclease
MTESSAVHTRRWTRQEYDRMIETGLLTPDDRVELIEGEILTVTPQGSAHATAVSLIHHRLHEITRLLNVHVRGQLPLALGPASEPEPDVAIVAGSERDYLYHHPTSALLVIEVADRTLAYDRDAKGSLYGQFGIAEYWIVNLVERRIEVYRDPEPHDHAGFGFRYRSVERYHAGDAIAPQALPGAAIAVNDLLP